MAVEKVQNTAFKYEKINTTKLITSFIKAAEELAIV